MRDHSKVILRPVQSEKSYELLAENVYTFVVAPDATKTEVRTAVEALFDVSVTKVNTLRRKGKRLRRYRRGSMVTGRRADTKRAYVTLAPGDSIDLF